MTRHRKSGPASGAGIAAGRAPCPYGGLPDAADAGPRRVVRQRDQFDGPTTEATP